MSANNEYQLVVKTYDGKEVVVHQRIADNIAEVSGLMKVVDVSGTVSYINPSNVSSITPLDKDGIQF